MIGVILWSDAAGQKAVIWCEDQGDLAYLANPDAVHLPDPFFGVGDIVEFDVMTERNLRLARNPARVRENWGASLLDGFRNLGGAKEHMTGVSKSAEITPFHIDHATRLLPRTVPQQQCRG